MAKDDLAGTAGRVVPSLDEHEVLVVRNALRLYMQSKKRQATQYQGDADLYPVFNGQLIRASHIMMKFGG